MKKLDQILRYVWTTAEELPWLVIPVLLALQTMLTLGSRDLWFSDEIRYANAFEHMVNAGKWIVLHLNGVPYPDKPPLYFWLLAALHKLRPVIDPALFHLGAAVSGLAMLAGTYALAGVTGDPVAPPVPKPLEYQPRRCLCVAASLVLLTTFYFVGLTHYSRMDLLFAALITFSHAALYRAWTGPDWSPWTIVGLGLAGLAALTKGPLGIAFPVLSSLVFLALRRDLRRLLSRDVAMGLGLMLAIVLAWLVAAFAVEGLGFIKNILFKQIVQRAVDTWHHPQPFWHYFLTLPLAWLPWTLILAVLPWRQIREGLARTRPRDKVDPGLVWLWSSVVPGLLLLSVISIKIVVYLLPLFAPLAVLTARGILHLPDERVSRLFSLIGILLLALGIALALLGVFGPVSVTPKGLAMAVLALLVTGHILYYWRAMSRLALMLVLYLGITLFIQPAALYVAPSLDTLMSPRAQAEVMRGYVQRGFVPVAYNIYSGTYTYHLGQNLVETSDMARVSEILETEPKVVLAMRKKDMEDWADRPASISVVHEQVIVDRPFVLLVKE